MILKSKPSPDEKKDEKFFSIDGNKCKLVASNQKFPNGEYKNIYRIYDELNNPTNQYKILPDPIAIAENIVHNAQKKEIVENAERQLTIEEKIIKCREKIEKL